MEPITTTAAVAAIVTYLAKKLKDDKSVSAFLNDFTEASINWIRPVFLKDDGSEEKIVQKLKEAPESEAKQNTLKAAILSELEDNPNATKWLYEMVATINKKESNEKSMNITNSKNVVTATIHAGGNVTVGDNNTIQK